MPFKPVKRFQLTCSKECEIKYSEVHTQSEKLYKGVCIKCKKEFRKTTTYNHEKTCERCKFEQRKKSRVYDNSKIVEKPKGLPLERLNKMAEHKRLMDEKWAVRTIKGKRWE
jgi:hypothetical protein